MEKTKSVTLHEVLIEFVNYQVQILSSLNVKYPNSSLYQLPRSFQIVSHGDVWKCRRHGAGIWFENNSNGIVIDAHKSIASYAVFDAWRLSTYLESKKIGKISVKNNYFGITEREVKSGLQLLVEMNVVEIDPATKLLRLS